MKIPELKPKSADFKSEKDAKPITDFCDVPGCMDSGDHRAPKSRALNEYYNFCLHHVREYNDNWNFFDGMSQHDVEQHLYNTMTWDRPTWASTISQINPDRFRSRIYEGIRMNGFNMGGNFSSFGDTDDSATGTAPPVMPTPEVEALATLDLAPPVVWDEIRTQYKKLVKKHHPDVSKDGDAETIKNINLAYSILKIAYSKFEKLDPR